MGATGYIIPCVMCGIAALLHGKDGEYDIPLRGEERVFPLEDVFYVMGGRSSV